MRRLGKLVSNRLHQGVVAGARTVYVAEAYVPLHEQVDTLHIPRAYTRSTVFAKKRAVTERETIARMSCVDRHSITISISIKKNDVEVGEIGFVPFQNRSLVNSG